MLFASTETQIYQELLQNSSYIGVATNSIQEALHKMAQQNRNKVTTVASLRTYLHTHYPTVREQVVSCEETI